MDLHEERLSSLENVVGLGIVAEDEETSSSRDCAVAVYVEKKVPSDELAPSERVPKWIEVPGRGKTKHRIQTRVIEQGEVKLEEIFDESNGLRG